jgi:hypothetical protein
MLAPRVAELGVWIVEVAPWTARPAFRAAVRAWAVAEAMCELYRQHFDDGVFDSAGEPRAGLVQWDRAEARASKLRAELGLTPQSLAKLLGTLTSVATAGGYEDGLTALKAEGQRMLAEREAAGRPEDKRRAE